MPLCFFFSAQCSNCNLFQRVCALGQLVSCECLKSCDMVSWLVDNGVCMSRELAVDICRGMVETDVLKPGQYFDSFGYGIL